MKADKYTNIGGAKRIFGVTFWIAIELIVSIDNVSNCATFADRKQTASLDVESTLQDAVRNSDPRVSKWARKALRKFNCKIQDRHQASFGSRLVAKLLYSK